MSKPYITYHYTSVTPHELQLLTNQHAYDSITVTVESYHKEGYPLYHVSFTESTTTKSSKKLLDKSFYQ